MRAYLFLKSRGLFQVALATLALSVVGVLAVSDASPAAAADDLTCSATAQDDQIALEWSASDQAPTVHVRQVLADGSTKWRLTTEATTASLPDFAFGIDAEYIVRYRLDDGVQDIPCETGATPPPPPPPGTPECIQVELGGDEAYLTWEDFGGSRYAVRRGTTASSSWVSTVTATGATVAAGQTYVVRSNGVETACEVLLDLDDDPDFECSLLPRFTTLMRLTWSDDGDARHQVRSVNVAAFEDQFFRNGSNNLTDVPVGPLYFIRRDSGDTPCLPTAADGTPLSPCVISDQPRSVHLNATDCDALTSLIEANVFPADPNPCNTLLGCNDRAVTQISLDLNGAPVPSAVGDFSALRSLTLENATGTVPQSIENSDLFKLSIGGSVEIPDLSNLGRLVDLEFSGSVPSSNVDTLSAKNVVVTDLNGSIPASLATIEGIKRLTISASDATTIPAELTVDTLQELRVSGSQVTGSLPELNAVRILDLSDTAVSGSIPASYATSALRELSLANTSVSGTLPDFGQTRNLTVLDVGNADLSGPIPASLGQSTSLVTIDLGGNDLSGSIPGELADIDTLRNLDLRKNELTGRLPAEFSNLDENFERLDLSGNNISGTIPSSWGSLAGNPCCDGFSRFEIDLADNEIVGPLPTFSGSEIVFFDLRNNRIEGDITDAAAYGLANDINFRWTGNSCLTVNNASVRADLDAEQPGWDSCD